MTFSLSKTVVSPEGEQIYTFEYAALVTETFITIVKFYIDRTYANDITTDGFLS